MKLKGLKHVAVLLQMKPYNIYVTVAYPPDTDTPGLAEENKTKVNFTIKQWTKIILYPPFFCI